MIGCINRKPISVHTCLLQGRCGVKRETIQGALWAVILRGNCQCKNVENQKLKYETQQRDQQEVFSFLQFI